MDDSLEVRVRRLEDLNAVRALIHRYARSLDRGDWAMMRGCFTADATDAHGPFQGSVDNLISGSEELLRPYWGMMHIFGQVNVEFASDDEARVESYALSFHRHHLDGTDDDSGDDEDTITGLRYLDKVVRTESGWLVAERVTVQEWNTSVTARDWMDASVWVTGRRDREDASYALGFDAE